MGKKKKGIFTIHGFRQHGENITNVSQGYSNVDNACNAMCSSIMVQKVEPQVEIIISKFEGQKTKEN